MQLRRSPNIGRAAFFYATGDVGQIHAKSAGSGPIDAIRQNVRVCLLGYALMGVKHIP